MKVVGDVFEMCAYVYRFYVVNYLPLVLLSTSSETSRDWIWPPNNPDITLPRRQFLAPLSDFRFITSFESLFTYITINVQSRSARIEFLNNISKWQAESIHYD